jgi:hypothetical protein
MTASDAKKSNAASKRKSKNRPNTVHHTNVHHLSRPTREYIRILGQHCSHRTSSIPLLAYKCCTAGRLILAGLAVCRANWLRTLIIKRNFYCVWRLAISHAIFHILTLHAIIGAEIECIARHVWARALIIHHFFEPTREVMSITLITHCLAQLMWDCGLSFDLFELLCAGQCFFCVYLAIQAHTAHLSREREKRTQHAFFCVSLVLNAHGGGGQQKATGARNK